MFVLIPGPLLAIFGMTDPIVLSIGRQLLLYLSVSGLFITVALSYTGGLQGTGDTRSPLYISIISQVIIPLGLCTLFQAMYGLEPGPHLDGDRRRPRDARDVELSCGSGKASGDRSLWISNRHDPKLQAFRPRSHLLLPVSESLSEVRPSCDLPDRAIEGGWGSAEVRAGVAQSASDPSRPAADDAIAARVRPPEPGFAEAIQVTSS